MTNVLLVWLDILVKRVLTTIRLIMLTPFCHSLKGLFIACRQHYVLNCYNINQFLSNDIMSQASFVMTTNLLIVTLM